jgi:hypothetical protein
MEGKSKPGKIYGMGIALYFKNTHKFQMMCFDYVSKTWSSDMKLLW